MQYINKKKKINSWWANLPEQFHDMVLVQMKEVMGMFLNEKNNEMIGSGDKGE